MNEPIITIFESNFKAMRRIICLVFAITMFFPLVNAEGPNVMSSGGGPAIAFDKDTINLGEMVTTDLPDGKFRFRVYNRGNEPLLIMTVAACCGSRVNEYTNSPIAAGDSGIVEIQFPIPPAPHRISRSVTVISNATNRQTSVLRILGTVVLPKDDGYIREEEF